MVSHLKKKNNIELKNRINYLIKYKIYLSASKHLNCNINQYIYGKINNNFIINLNYTILMLQRCIFFLYNNVLRNNIILIIGQSQLLNNFINQNMNTSNFFYIPVTQWKPGFLTNFKTYFPFALKNRFKNLPNFKVLTKLPDVLILLNPVICENILNEGYSLGIPIIGIIDLNCTKKILQKITYAIPGNNTSFQSIFFFTIFFSKIYFFSRLKKLKKYQLHLAKKNDFK